MTTTPSLVRNTSREILTEPFRHIVIDDVFDRDFHDALVKVLEERRNAGYVEGFDPRFFSRYQGYDAYHWTFPPLHPWPLDFFYSTGWRDYFQELFDIPLTDDVSADFHYHPPQSKRGFVHNDYNPAFFPDYPANGKMNPYYYQCSYFGKDDRRNVRERVRAVAVLYYLGNAPWRVGDGGETGLYKGVYDALPVKKVAPINNRILAFECCPTSFHGFLRNHKHIRNSIMQWFHGEKETILARYGGAPLVPWP